MADRKIQNTVFEIPKDGYLAFDALSMKQLITENLNKTGVFSDQNYEGSYIANIINVIAYSYSGLMFYLNKTSTETMFTEAQIYENMNRIVKMLGYNPIGFQSSILPFKLQAINLSKDLYVIPRYSYFIKNGISYSFNDDIIFNKAEDASAESLTDVNNGRVLYQGRFYEHPPFVATGEDNESFIFAVDDETLVDHFNIFVYRYSSEVGTWEQWTSTENLFLDQADSKKYEIRLNPESNYEIKFGNNINGLKLIPNDKIAIYYLQSDGSSGEISEGQLNDANYVRFYTNQFNSIYTDLNTTNATIVADTNNLIIENVVPSTRSKNGESPDDMRQAAPSLFKTQYRLVTAEDYKTFILNNYANFIQDASVVNNWSYIAGRLKYYHDLGLSNPDRAGGPLYAQVNFADSCNFNNVYVTAVPKTSVSTTAVAPSLSISQKQVITNALNPRKTLTAEIVMLDPVYIAADVALPSDNEKITTDDIAATSILITKTPTTKRTDDDIRADIQKIFTDTFDQNNLKLGQSINLISLEAEVVSIQGVSEVHTMNTVTNAKVQGLVFYMFDPIYPAQIKTVTTSIDIEDFEFVYYYNIHNLPNRIEFEQNPSAYEKIEF